jgi:Asp/Glu/hydantoin racemase
VALLPIHLGFNIQTGTGGGQHIGLGKAGLANLADNLQALFDLTVVNPVDRQ